MSDYIDTSPATDRFQWHPEYGGKSHESVHRELVDAIRRDQQAYQTALESAEKEEFGAFNTVRDLEKRWSEYDFAWFELEPEHLADKILRFETERESRQELIGWQDWKNQSSPKLSPAVTSDEKRDWRTDLSEEQRKRLASAMAIGVIVLFVLMCMGLWFLVR